MTLPPIYANSSSPLYDERRNPAHQPPVPLDLDFSGTPRNRLSPRYINIATTRYNCHKVQLLGQQHKHAQKKI
jgi:hypothetical protein